MGGCSRRVFGILACAGIAACSSGHSGPGEPLASENEPLVSPNGAITAQADETRSNWYPNQSGLDPSIVSGPTFGRLFKTALPLSAGEQVFAEPLAVGTSVFIATEANDIYSLDSATGSILASRALGQPWNASDSGCGDLTPTVGVTGTPVIDASSNTAYFFSKTYVSGTAAWYAHAVDANTLAEKPGFPVAIQGTAANDSTVSFNPSVQMQRTALLLMNGVVYGGFGAHCDYGKYHGWIVGVNESGGIATMFATEAGSAGVQGAGIWQSGAGLASDRPGRIFFATSNGYSNSMVDPIPGSTPPAVLDQSVVRTDLQGDGTLRAMDFFAPYDEAYLDKGDLDLGSGGVVVLPSQYATTTYPHLGVAGGKQGTIYLLNLDSLGGFQQGPMQSDAVLGQLSAAGGMWSTPALWPGDGGWMYVTSNQSPLQAFRIGVLSDGVTPALSAAGKTTDNFGYTSGTPVVTSDGTNSGSALVWVTYSTGAYGSGQLRAYNALPNSSGNLTLAYEDAYGEQSKFSMPGVGVGRVYVGTADGNVLGYGAPTTSALSGPPANFGTIVEGQTATQNVVITANTATQLTAISSSSSTFAVGTPSSPLPVTLASGGTVTVPVTFKPTAAQRYVAALDLTSSAGSGAISLEGVGESATGVLAVSAPSISFGGIEVGSTNTSNLTLSNNGATPVTFAAPTLPTSPFAVTGAPTAGQTLAPGATVTVSVAFAPTASGMFTSSLVINSDSGDATIYLSGSSATTGFLEIQPSSLDFGTIATGTTHSLTFSLYNSGGIDITITKSKPPSEGVFVATTTLNEGTVIPAGATVTETIVFEPTADGLFTDQWTLGSTDGSGAQNVTFTGKAGSGSGLQASYYASDDLSGPVVLSRVDPQIDFDWGGGAPDPSLPSTNFSVRWTGQIEALTTEQYTFYTTADDGIRLYVNDTLLVNDFVAQPTTTESATINLVAGQKYDIRVEYFQATGGDVAKLEWSSPTVARQFVPTLFLFPTGYTGGAPDAGSGTADGGTDAAPDAGGGQGVDAGRDSGGGDATVGSDAGTGSGSGLLGTYYPTLSFGGTPVTRVDPTINFNWNGAAPAPTIPGTGFSVRWTGQIQAQFSETYTFTTTADDGIRLWVNGTLLIDDWVDQATTTKSGTIALVAGQEYTIKVEYYQDTGGDVAELQWSSPSTPLEVVPQSQLSPTTPDAGAPTGPPAGSGDGLSGSYYPAPSFGGTPITRVDPIIDFNWGGKAPMSGIPATGFSVRWTGQVLAQYSETYSFSTTADDGIRLWVNGTLLVDDWVDQGPTTKSGTMALVAGEAYAIKIEYYQDGGGDVAELTWSSPSTPNAIVPQSQLYSTSSPIDGGVPPVDSGAPADAGGGVADAGSDATSVDAQAESGAHDAAADAIADAASDAQAEAAVEAGIDAAPEASVDAGADATVSPDAGSDSGAQSSQPGLMAQYFPALAFGGTPVTRVDPTINFNWNGAAPATSIPGTNFSVRWTGQVLAQHSETYTFSTTADDGIRLWVNGALLIDDWVDQASTTKTGTMALVAGQQYPIKVEYFQATGGDVAKLSWSSPSTASQVIPSSQLSSLTPDAGAPSGPPPGNGDGLSGSYYPAPEFGGTPVVEVDPVIDFNWGGNPPLSSIPATGFSVRWTGNVLAQYSETYTFSTTADDGIRLWVNGTLLVDDWVDQGPTTESGTIALIAGTEYAIKIEYYQDGGGDVAELTWSSPSTPNAIVPQSQLFSH
jgi:hypothetical protein